MGLAIDTIGFNAITGAVASVYANAAADAGDSLTVRQFVPGSMARLEYVGLQPAAAGVTGVQVKSPALHDNVQGLEFQTSESPAVFLMPDQQGEPLQPGDTLTAAVEISLAAATVIGGALGIYYANLSGIAASLKMRADIFPNIDHLKAFPVTPGAVAANVWLDTAIGAAAAQLKADRYYAVLGYISSDPYIALGVKGQATGNLRVAGPGTSTSITTDTYFVDQSDSHMTPHIPVFYANDRNSVYVSGLSALAIAAPKPVTLICAQMVASYQP